MYRKKTSNINKGNLHLMREMKHEGTVMQEYREVGLEAEGNALNA